MMHTNRDEAPLTHHILTNNNLSDDDSSTDEVFRDVYPDWKDNASVTSYSNEENEEVSSNINEDSLIVSNSLLNESRNHDASVPGHSNEQNQEVNLTKKTIATSPRSDSLNNYTLFCNKLNSIAQKNSDLSIPFGLASAFLILTCVTESPMPVIGIAALLLAITILTFLYRVCCHSEQKTDEKKTHSLHQ